MTLQKLYLFGSIAVLVTMIAACRSNKELIPPPGTIKLSETVYIDDYPISNIEYVEFLSSLSVYWSLETSDSLASLKPYGLAGRNYVSYGNYLTSTTGTDKRHKKVPYNIFEAPFYGMPDSILYKNMMLKDTTFYDGVDMETYLYHPAYRRYPVLNVSPAQAAMFCKWRTDLVQIMYAVTHEDSLEHLEHAKMIKYRLPKKEEWIEAMERADLNFSAPKDSAYQGGEPVVDVYYYYNKKDTFQFYTLPNYLSELVEGDQYINYNWTDSLQTLDIKTVRPFESVSPGIGFRCACDVEK